VGWRYSYDVVFECFQERLFDVFTVLMVFTSLNPLAFDLSIFGVVRRDALDYISGWRPVDHVMIRADALSGCPAFESLQTSSDSPQTDAKQFGSVGVCPCFFDSVENFVFSDGRKLA
jgi:hypothetical protein